jgi:hypothetical protein
MDAPPNPEYYASSSMLATPNFETRAFVNQRAMRGNPLRKRRLAQRLRVGHQPKSTNRGFESYAKTRVAWRLFFATSGPKPVRQAVSSRSRRRLRCDAAIGASGKVWPNDAIVLVT